jgi:DNA-binding NarL/FixJ family response regulator
MPPLVTVDASSAPPLTGRETQILRQASQGLRTQDIASWLGISKKTVQAHIRNIFLKLGVRSRTEAVARAIRSGWV